jgi:hypothetical protein
MVASKIGLNQGVASQDYIEMLKLHAFNSCIPPMAVKSVDLNYFILQLFCN